MYCKKCGKEIPDDSVFCLYCGTNLKESITESPRTEEPIKVDVNANWKAKKMVRCVLRMVCNASNSIGMWRRKRQILSSYIQRS